MRVHWLQHVPYEGLGHVGTWLAARRATVARTRLFAGDRLPAPDAVDLLIVLGGPMSVNDEAALPWLRDEKALLREVIAGGGAVLGICLGAQLIAAALGARVGPAREREVGWWPVRAVPPPPAGKDPAGVARCPFPAETTCLHWHGETFELPPGALHLARSEGCEHQALQVGRRVVGVQFHPEATPDWARTVLTASPESLAPGRYVMPANELTADLEARCRAGNLLAERILEFITS